jgi:hypothetical protein
MKYGTSLSYTKFEEKMWKARIYYILRCINRYSLRMAENGPPHDAKNILFNISAYHRITSRPKRQKCL